MRLLHLAAGNLFGGVEAMLLTLARERRAAPDLEQELAVCFDGRLSREAQDAGVAVHALGGVSARRPWQVKRARDRLAAVVRERGVDVVLAHGCWPYAVVGPGGVAGGARAGLFLHDRVRGSSWVERWAGRRAPDLLLANSRFTRASAGELWPGREVHVLHPPVSPPPPAQPGARARVRAALGVAEGEVVLFLAARLERWKGHALLLDALSRVRQPGWRCLIAGGPQRPHERAYLGELEARVRAHGLGERVTFLGQRSDVRELLLAADLHCQPNVGPEPFGVTFVEALWAGVPVVTTALGGALEVVDATCGRLVPPEPDALAAALDALIADPAERARLGAAGPARARALCDPAAQLARLRALLGPAPPAPRPDPAGPPTPPAPPPAPPRWVELVASAARAAPRGRYALPDLACRLAARAGALPGPFLGRLEVPGGTARFVCDLRDKNCREVCFTRRYEPQERAIVEALLGPGDVFVDVGANWGYFSLLAAFAVGAPGRVLALEPDPRMFELLSRNVALNHLDQVEPLQVAASDRAGALELVGFDEAGGNFGVSTLQQGAVTRPSGAPRPAGAGRTYRVDARPVDDVLDERGLERVALLKMDIEGAEGLAIEGLRRGLAAGRYRALLLELHPDALARMGVPPERLEGHLRDAGYVGWTIDHSPEATRRAAYAQVVDPGSVLRPHEPGARLDAWPHQVWLAPGVRAPR